jgi:molybdenum cofactor sulfurtransferase
MDQLPNSDSIKSKFLEAYPDYLKTTSIDEWRSKDYNRLDDSNHVYLDYTGGSLYAQSQVVKHQEYLLKNVLGNPHSTNPSSMKSTFAVEEARASVLRFFNANDYVCVFTPNATGALKIIGESYPFTEKSHFLLPFDNHNSVNGIREYAKNKGGSYTYSPIQIEDLRFQPDVLMSHLSSHGDSDKKLFAYPAQSNVSGVQHDFKWISIAQEHGWDVLLDASAYVPTNRLDLTTYQPEFVSLSFYKMFGYPTGLGALLIRKDKLKMLQKPWFAGGTVTLASVMAEQFFLEESHARFEDGTINYLDIPTIKIGLDHLSAIGMDTIHQRVMILSQYILDVLPTIRHANGSQVVRIFGPQNTDGRGGTFILNIFDPEGNPIPFTEVEESANTSNYSIRTGCFCNPGIDEINNQINQDTLRTYFETREAGDYFDMQEYLHQMRGAVRISLGIVSNFEDVYQFVSFVESFRKS